MTVRGHIVDTGRPRLVSDLVWDPSDQEAQAGLTAHCSQMVAAPDPHPRKYFP